MDTLLPGQINQPLSIYLYFSIKFKHNKYILVLGNKLFLFCFVCIVSGYIVLCNLSLYGDKKEQSHCFDKLEMLMQVKTEEKSFTIKKYSTFWKVQVQRKDFYSLGYR